MQSQLNTEETTVRNSARTGQAFSAEMEELVVFVRLELYNRGLLCGPKALRTRLADHYAVTSLPSERTIARMLARNGLTYRRTGWYEGEEWIHPLSTARSAATVECSGTQDKEATESTL